jgi:uncharacterized RDD family membrane protein YckC
MASLATAARLRTSRAGDPLDTTVEIETPEHIRFRHRIAGPARRALAYAIDCAVRFVLVLGVVFLVATARPGSAETLQGASTGLQLVLLFLIDWAYYVLFETLWSGRSPGKRLLSLRVVKDGGHPLTFTDSLLRNLVRAADFLPFAYAVGLVVMSNDKSFRRLGDLAAGTIVILEQRSAVLGSIVVKPPPTAAELRALPQRLPLSGEELEGVELFLRRVGTLSVLREAELAEMVAPLFAKRMGVRYKDPVRFLALLHYQAHAGARAPEALARPRRGT